MSGKTTLKRTVGRITFDDPYAWLEADSPEVRAWQRAQADRADQAISWPGRQALAERVAPFISEGFAFAPQHFGPYWFNFGVGAGGAVLTVADSPVASGRPLVDPAKLVQPGRQSSLDYFFPSPKGRYVAFGASEGGDEQSTLHIIETASGRILGARFRFTSNTIVSWLADESGFFFSGGASSDFQDVRKSLFFHRVGAPAESVRREPVCSREQYSIRPQVSADGRWVAAVTSELFPRPDYIRRLPDGHWAPFLVDVPGQCYGVFDGERYLAITTIGAPRGRLVSIPLETGANLDTWTELLPQGPYVLRSLERVGEQFVLCAFDDACARLFVLTKEGAIDHEVPLPGKGVARQLGLLSHYQLIGYGGDNIVPGVNDFTFVHSTLTRSPAVYRYDLTARRLDELRAPRFVHEDFHVAIHEARAPDGAVVRYRQIARADLDSSIPRPTLVYGYGGFNVNFIPGYLGGFAEFVRSGGVFVFMHLRGGCEYGLGQWLDGRMGAKQHTFDDAIAVAEDLIARKVTQPDKLAAFGASGGGLLTGALLVQRPDLWRAVCSLVPLYDMMNFTRDPYTALCALDLGHPSDPEAAAWLYKYSPYHNVRDAAYPATLIVAAMNDMRCWPWHARKLAARVQAANIGSQPILLKIEEGRGHMGSQLDPDGVAATLGFLMRQLGMDT